MGSLLGQFLLRFGADGLLDLGLLQHLPTPDGKHRCRRVATRSSCVSPDEALKISGKSIPEPVLTEAKQLEPRKPSQLETLSLTHLRSRAHSKKHEHSP